MSAQRLFKMIWEWYQEEANISDTVENNMLNLAIYLKEHGLLFSDECEDREYHKHYPTQP